MSVYLTKITAATSRVRKPVVVFVNEAVIVFHIPERRAVLTQSFSQWKHAENKHCATTISRSKDVPHILTTYSSKENYIWEETVMKFVGESGRQNEACWLFTVPS